MGFLKKWIVHFTITGMLCFIPRANIFLSLERNIMHLFPLHKGDMKICSPEKSHISRGQRPREIWLFRGWTNFHISLIQGKLMFYSTRPTFWWILSNEICWPSLFTKLFFSEHLWSYYY